KVKQREECTAADNARQALKQVQQAARSQKEGSEMLSQTSRKRKSFEIALENKKSVELKQYKV
ncbi:MAG: hypothetical protein MJE68_34155, partial [Proteobacteria bacterium]|nr:hypothetical protein [Pseudomonadota bacterium]